MSSIASQLTTMQSSFSSQLGALQSNFSRQLSAMSQQQSQLMDRLDRVEESIHGSGKGSPNLDFWTTRPAVTAFPAVVPEPLDQPQSRTLTLRESSYAEGSCPETEPLRKSLRLLNKPRPDYRFPGRSREAEQHWLSTESHHGKGRRVTIVHHPWHTSIKRQFPYAPLVSV